MERVKRCRHGLMVLMSWGIASVAFAQNEPTPEVVSVAARIGLEPESIVVAGLHAEVSQILGRLGDEATLMAELSIRESVVAQLSSELAEVSLRVQGRMDDAPLRNQFEALTTQRDAAAIQVREALTALRDRSLDGVSAASRATMDLWQETQSRRVPAAFRVKTFDSAQWEAIEIALRAEVRAAQRQVPLGTEEETLLAQVRSDPAVVEASQRLTEHLATVEAAMSPDPES